MMKRRSTTKRVSILATTFVTVSMMLASQFALAADHPFYATGDTGITDAGVTSASASISPPLPVSLSISSGDTISVQYNITWDDDRTSPALLAMHNFTVALGIDNNTPDIDWTLFYTSGDESGSDTLTVTTPPIYEDCAIYIDVFASVKISDQQKADDEDHASMPVVVR